MARSHTIWLVFRVGQPHPVGCFTVKHECARWVQRQEWWEHELDIFKAPDGGGPAVFYGAATDLVKEYEA